jgi:hypothetical protein
MIQNDLYQNILYKIKLIHFYINTFAGTQSSFQDHFFLEQLI